MDRGPRHDRLDGSPAAWGACLDLDGSEHPVAGARAWARQTLAAWGIDVRAASDIVLVVSELVANARLHTGRPRRVALRPTRRGIRVEVVDDSPTAPAPRPTSPGRPGGYGLLVVDRLATAWGADLRAAGKSVWALMPRSASANV